MEAEKLFKKIRDKCRSASTALMLYMEQKAGCTFSKLEDSALKNLYPKPLTRPKKKLNVYHLGHSLVGRTMPLMLQQLAGPGHNFRSQLGWGASLKEHWEPEMEIKGFDKENNHENYESVFDAIRGARFDAFVLTEMVEIKDAVIYYDSARYLQMFVDEIAQYNPNARVFLYESWHRVTDQEGWITRLDRDLDYYWLGKIVDRAHRFMKSNKAIYIIPVGQVMSAFFKEIARRGGIEGINNPEDIFTRSPDGSLDDIHVNDIGSYLNALVHYAVLYQRSPEGLPYQLKNETGGNALAPSKDAAKLMQEITWRVVSDNYRTGIVTY